jgi:hypothetical protein
MESGFNFIYDVRVTIDEYGSLKINRKSYTSINSV